LAKEIKGILDYRFAHPFHLLLLHMADEGASE